MMYAITWNEDGTRLVQVGISPKRLLEETKQNEISTVVASMPFYKGIEIFVADAKTEIIKGATDSGWIGKTLETLGITSAKTKGEKTGLFYAKFDGNLCRYSLCQDDNYIVVVTVENTFYLQSTVFAILIVGVYLILASCCMIYLLSRVMKEKYEKEKLIYTSTTDELTRCLNRHAYEEDLNRLDPGKEWIYLSMDLNGLKQANDSLGHAAGDELLRAAADQMKESFSPYGKVYRIGGDEFAVILTKKVQELPALLKDFDHRVFQWHGELTGSMAISYGYVFSSEKKWSSIYEITKAADQRMYENKTRYYLENGLDRRK